MGIGGIGESLSPVVTVGGGGGHDVWELRSDVCGEGLVR